MKLNEFLGKIIKIFRFSPEEEQGVEKDLIMVIVAEAIITLSGKYKDSEDVKRLEEAAQSKDAQKVLQVFTELSNKPDYANEVNVIVQKIILGWAEKIIPSLPQEQGNNIEKDINALIKEFNNATK